MFGIMNTCIQIVRCYYMKTTDKLKDASKELRANWWYENIVKLWPLPESPFKPKVSEKELYLLDKVDLKNTKIKSVIVLEETYDCKTWSSAMGIILSKLFSLEEVPIDSIVSLILSNVMAEVIHLNAIPLRQ